MAYIGNTNTTQGFIPAVDYFNGDGATVAFTLSRPVASVAQVQAVIENVPQAPGDAYTVSGNTLTFTSAPPLGTGNIYVYYTSPITQLIAPGAGTVTNTSFANGASEFASGTRLSFQQTAAPTGWTKDTTHNNKALRIVSGTASSGGSVAFTTVFTSQSVSGSVGGTTLSTSQVPNATGGFNWHGAEAGSSAWQQSGVFGGSGTYNGYRSPGGASGGATSMQNVSFSLGFGGGSHDHSFSGTAINLAVQYVDVIIATKD
jgi:hypothetical protein